MAVTPNIWSPSHSHRRHHEHVKQQQTVNFERNDVVEQHKARPSIIGDNEGHLEINSLFGNFSDNWRQWRACVQKLEPSESRENPVKSSWRIVSIGRRRIELIFIALFQLDFLDAGLNWIKAHITSQLNLACIVFLVIKTKTESETTWLDLFVHPSRYFNASIVMFSFP